MQITESTYTLLAQIPLAGIVVVVVVVFLYFLDKWLKAERDARTRNDESMRLFLREEREQNTAFLREQSEGHNGVIARLAEEIKAIRAEVAQMSGTLVAHDVRSQEARKTNRNP